MEIKVKRHIDRRVFTNDMSNDECILEIHFCTSYTQVIVQEKNSHGYLVTSDIICNPVGSNEYWVDLIAVQDSTIGEFV